MKQIHNYKMKLSKTLKTLSDDDQAMAQLQDYEEDDMDDDDLEYDRILHVSDPEEGSDSDPDDIDKPLSNTQKSMILKRRHPHGIKLRSEADLDKIRHNEKPLSPLVNLEGENESGIVLDDHISDKILSYRRKLQKTLKKSF
eukprot:UN24662